MVGGFDLSTSLIRCIKQRYLSENCGNRMGPRRVYALILSIIFEIHSCFNVQLSISPGEMELIQDDVQLLTDGVQSISVGERKLSGTISTFGKYAYVLSDMTEESSQIWAAARLGSGRICAFAQGSFCDVDSKENERAIRNCIKWISNKQGRSSTPVGMILTKLEVEEGHRKSQRNRFETLDDLNSVDFVVAYRQNLDSQKKADIMKTFVRSGGGLLVCSTSWTVTDLTNFPTNDILFDAGLAFANDVGPTSVKIVNTPVNQLWLGNLWYNAAVILQKNSFDPSPKPNSAELLANYVSLIPGFLFKNSLNPYISNFTTAAQLLTVYSKMCNGSELIFPVDKTTNPREYHCVSLIHAVRNLISLNENHPIVNAARIIPGYPFFERSVKTITVQIPKTHTGWRSTGIFAWPGSTINVSVPPFMVSSRYRLLIGCHTDNIRNIHDDYRRWPVVNMSVAISSTQFSFNTYSGGLIYLNVADISNDDPQATITFSGQIVSSPRYVLGETSEVDWASMVAKPRAPLTEIESKNVVVIVNSSQTKWVKDIKKLATWYDHVFEKYYDLSGSPRRTFKQYVVIDVQTYRGKGSAHSGYPIVFDEGYHADRDKSYTRKLLIPGIDVAEEDKYEVRVYHWGIFHEIGHNFQKKSWTSSDEREVTNNIFSLYLEEIYPDGPFQFGSKDYSPSGKGFKMNEFYAQLGFYIDLKQAFGWEAFRRFFRVFETNSSITANNNINVNDNWLRYFSHVVKRDISPLMSKYNKLTSSDAKSSVSKYPTWDSNMILDCKTVRFEKSPCMTVSYNKRISQICIDMVAWARINGSEALEIKFRGGSTENSVRSVSDVKSFTFNQSTQILRITSTTRINPEDKRTWCANVTDGFSFTEVTVRIVSISNSRVVHVAERTVEGVITLT